jgi:hypothetical protein
MFKLQNNLFWYVHRPLPGFASNLGTLGFDLDDFSLQIVYPHEGVMGVMLGQYATKLNRSSSNFLKVSIP